MVWHKDVKPMMLRLVDLVAHLDDKDKAEAQSVLVRLGEKWDLPDLGLDLQPTNQGALERYSERRAIEDEQAEVEARSQYWQYELRQSYAQKIQEQTERQEADRRQAAIDDAARIARRERMRRAGAAVRG